MHALKNIFKEILMRNKKKYTYAIIITNSTDCL